MSAVAAKRGVRDGVRKRDGKWLVNWVDDTGRHEKVTHAKSAAEARDVRAQLISKKVQQRLGLWEGDPDLTFKALFETFSKTASTRANWKTQESYFRNHLLPAFGSRKVRGILPSEVDAFLVSKEGSLSPRSIQHLRTYGRTLINFGIRDRSFRGDNAFGLSRPIEVQDKEVTTLPLHLVHDVVEAVPERWRNFFAFAVYTGMRSGELRALRPQSIDPHHRWISVTRSGTRKTTKTNRARPIPIPVALLPYLRDALRQAEGRELLFVDTFGNQLSRHIKAPNVLREALAKLGLINAFTLWCKTSGCHFREKGRTSPKTMPCPKCSRALAVLPEAPIVFHDLRKTWESYLAELGGDPVAAARLAGHSLEVAGKHYIGANKQRLEQLADRMDFKKLVSTNTPLERAGGTEHGAAFTEHELASTDANGAERQ